MATQAACPSCGASWKYDEAPGEKAYCAICGDGFVLPAGGAPQAAKGPPARPVGDGHQPSAPSKAWSLRSERVAAPSLTSLPTASAPPAGAAPPSSVDWRAGQVIEGLYEVLGLLGEGGMGRVYRVRHRGWGLDLAVKSPRPELLAGAGGREAFVAEAETWVKLGLHPHVVSCYYVRSVGGLPRVFAEYVSGGSLADAIASRRLYEGGPRAALRRVLDVAIQFAWGLAYAHDAGLVHQDVKPANVMLGAGGVVKVTDFGLARGLGAGGAGVTFAGMTPAYGSPEQFQRQRLTAATDVWSWAASVLEMFTGGVHWTLGAAAGEALEQWIEAGPDDDALPPMPPPVAALLRRCFLSSPRERPASLRAAADELRRYHAGVAGAYERAEPSASEGRSDALTNRAVSLLDLGRPGEALPLLREALAHDPQHPEATYNAALLGLRAGEVSEAQALGRVQRCCHLEPRRWERWAQLAWIQLERGEVHEATRALERAEALAAGQPELAQLRRKLAPAIVPVRMLAPGLAAHALAATPSGSLIVASMSGTPDQVVAFEGGTGRRLWSTPESAEALALTPDGRVVASASEDGTITLRDGSRGSELARFFAHDGGVTSVALSDDASLLVSGGRDGRCLVWDLILGRPCEDLQAAPGEGDVVTGVALSGDARRAAAITVEPERSSYRVLWWAPGSRPKVWAPAGFMASSEEASKALRDPAELMGGMIVRSNLSRDHNRVALARGGAQVIFTTATQDQVGFWWPERPDPPRVLAAGYGWMTHRISLALGPDGRLATSGGLRGVCRLWSVDGRWLRSIEGTSGATALCSGDHLVLSRGEGLEVARVAVQEVAPARLVRPSGSEEVAAEEQRFAGLLAEASGLHQQGRLAEALARLAGARSLPGKGRSLAAIRLWRALAAQARRGAFCGSWEEQSLAIEGSKWLRGSLDGDEVLLSDERSIERWSLDRGEHLGRFDEPGERVYALATTADLRTALTCGRDSRMRLWSREGLLRTFDGPDDVQRIALLSPDGRRSFSCAGFRGRQVLVYDTERGSCDGQLEGHERNLEALALSADGRRLASVSNDHLCVFDALSLRLLWRMPCSPGSQLEAAAWGPGWLAVSVRAYRSGTGIVREVYFLDAGSGRTVGQLGAPEGALGSDSNHPIDLCVSDDGALLAAAVSSSIDSSPGRPGFACSLWDLRSASLVDRIEGSFRQPYFDRLGRLLLLDGGGVRRFHLDWELHA